MKKFIFSLIVLVGSFSAYADESKSHYQVLGDLFKIASAPDMKKLVGVTWTGRCFNKKQPNTPTNGGYIFRVDRKTDAGPIGRDNETYEAALYLLLPPIWGETPNFLDKMTFEEIKINFYLSKIKFYEDSISIDLIERQTSELRIAGEFLVEETEERNFGEYWYFDTVKNGTYETIERCYYSIPEYSKNNAKEKAKEKDKGRKYGKK